MGTHKGNLLLSHRNPTLLLSWPSFLENASNQLELIVLVRKTGSMWEPLVLSSGLWDGKNNNSYVDLTAMFSRAIRILTVREQFFSRVIWILTLFKSMVPPLHDLVQLFIGLRSLTFRTSLCLLSRVNQQYTQDIVHAHNVWKMVPYNATPKTSYDVYDTIGVLERLRPGILLQSQFTEFEDDTWEIHPFECFMVGHTTYWEFNKRASHARLACLYINSVVDSLSYPWRRFMFFIFSLSSTRPLTSYHPGQPWYRSPSRRILIRYLGFPSGSLPA